MYLSNVLNTKSSLVSKFWINVKILAPLVTLNRLSAPKYFLVHLIPHMPYLHRALPLPWRPGYWWFDCSWRSGKYLVLLHRHLETLSTSISDLNRHGSKIARMVSYYAIIAWIALGIADHSLCDADDRDRAVQLKMEAWHFWVAVRALREGTAIIHVQDTKAQPGAVKPTLKGKKKMTIIIVYNSHSEAYQKVFVCRWWDFLSKMYIFTL